MNHKFIIAHYNENLDWLKPYAKQSYIYHKGNNTKAPFDCYYWEKLPNVGREGHTYLYHIIKNYDNLAGINIFLQGNIIGHQEEGLCPKNVEDYYLELEKKNFYTTRIFLLKRDECLVGKLKENQISFLEFFRLHAGRKLSLYYYAVSRGCFSIKKDLIRQNDLNFYKGLIRTLENHSNPKEGYYLERLWFSFFGLDKILTKKEKWHIMKYRFCHTPLIWDFIQIFYYIKKYSLKEILQFAFRKYFKIGQKLNRNK